MREEREQLNEEREQLKDFEEELQEITEQEKLKERKELYNLLVENEEQLEVNKQLKIKKDSILPELEQEVE